MPLPSKIERLKGNRVECTVTIPREQVAPAENKALRKLAEKTKLIDCADLRDAAIAEANRRGLDVGRERAALEAVNLERWRLSGEPAAWVQEHRAGWGHEDWLALIASFETSFRLKAGPGA